jgi:hypothetical protein
MKVKKLPALRGKRGLHRVSGAEPQVVGLALQTMKEKKADTMKTYLLKNTNAVEPKAATQLRPLTNCQKRAQGLRFICFWVVGYPSCEVEPS